VYLKEPSEKRFNPERPCNIVAAQAKHRLCGALLPRALIENRRVGKADESRECAPDGVPTTASTFMQAIRLGV
jgi:hypothetical protein